MVEIDDSTTVGDEELVARLKSGREDSLDELYRRYARKLYVFFSATLGVRQPEDLVHDTFVRVLDSVDQFDPQKAPFRAWLFRIARNRATDLRRRERKIGFRSIERSDRPEDDGDPVRDDPPDPAPGTVEQVLRDDLCAAVRACLAELDDDEREAFVLYYLGDRVLREIGDAFGKSISTARNWIHAASAKMRRCLTSKGIEP